MHDVIVVGAGPVGLACAIEARRQGLSALVIDKGTLVNSIVGYPARMEFFSTPELIEIGGHPFPVQGYKPTREEAIEYYRGVAAREGISTSACTNACSRSAARSRHSRSSPTRGEHAGAPRRSSRPASSTCRTGWTCRARTCRRSPTTTREPYRYVRQKVAIVGAKNSAAKAALDCHRHGAEVTLVVRAPALSDKIKYWIKPDLENRIKEGSIRAYFDTAVEAIRETSIVLRTPARRRGDRERLGAWR